MNIHRTAIDTLILETLQSQKHYQEAYTRQADRIRQIEASGMEASDEEYERLFQLEDAMKAVSL